ncbi:MAG: hypothetical protein IPL86_03350 [Flavobacteriales bacterium]|nr:hypothetical protein [Flavobacteriales bacterium]
MPVGPAPTRIFGHGWAAKRIRDKRLSIPNWDKGDRPRERMMAMGAKALSDAELVAILIRAGTPSLALWKWHAKYAPQQAMTSMLATSTPHRADEAPRVGEAALSILAALELGQRRRAPAPRGARALPPARTCSKNCATRSPTCTWKNSGC